MTHRDSEVSTLIRRRSSVLALAALAAIAATPGCGSSDPPPEDTYVNAIVKPALDSMNNNLCNQSSATPTVVIGTQGASLSQGPTPVQDGNAGVNIVCTVNAGFNVQLQALTSAGPTGGGSITIAGAVDSNSSALTGITATLTGNGDSFSANNCTLAPLYGGGPIPTKPYIAPGRIWSHLSCPTMASTSGKSKVINGKVVTEVCDIEADFLFENCGQ